MLQSCHRPLWRLGGRAAKVRRTDYGADEQFVLIMRDWAHETAFAFLAALTANHRRHARSELFGWPHLAVAARLRSAELRSWTDRRIGSIADVGLSQAHQAHIRQIAWIAV